MASLGIVVVGRCGVWVLECRDYLLEMQLRFQEGSWGIYRRLRQPGCLRGSRRHAKAWLEPLTGPPRVMFVPSEGCRAAVKLSRGLGAPLGCSQLSTGGRSREPSKGRHRRGDYRR
jgi:hypothetical protein